MGPETPPACVAATAAAWRPAYRRCACRQGPPGRRLCRTAAGWRGRLSTCHSPIHQPAPGYRRYYGPIRSASLSAMRSSAFVDTEPPWRHRYGEAVRWLCESASRRPNMQAAHLMLAAAYAQSGQLEEARKQAAEVLRINPGFTIERWKGFRLIFKYPKEFAHRDGLRKAGLPES
jgi:hypothetical protein